MSMNKFLWTAACVCLLASCGSGSDSDEPVEVQQPKPVLELSVSACDFVTIYETGITESGDAINFQSNDRVGVIIIEGSNTLIADNLPYIYNGTSWTFDEQTASSENTENGGNPNKTQPYCDDLNDKTNITYIVYYPYKKEANGVTDVNGLKNKFPFELDQSTEDAYRACDLMFWQSSATPGSPMKKLNAEMKHAFASVSISPQVRWELANNEEISYVSFLIFNVKFSVDVNNARTIYYPYQAEDRNFRCILPDGYSSDIIYEFGYNEYLFRFSISLPGRATANMCYVSIKSSYVGEYGLGSSRRGDFYCKDKNGAGYLIPGDAPLTTNQQSACIGIVVKAGGDNSGNWKDDRQYKFKDGIDDLTRIHGYVLALKNANGGKPCIWGLNTSIGTAQDEATGFYGYTNTQKIKAAVRSNSTLESDFPATYHATDGYEQTCSAPDNSSGWFFPSVGQCAYWFKYKDVLKSSMDQAGGDGWEDSYYWSNSENTASENDVWCLFFNNGCMADSKGNERYVRSWLVF